MMQTRPQFKTLSQGHGEWLFTDHHKDQLCEGKQCNFDACLWGSLLCCMSLAPYKLTQVFLRLGNSMCSSDQFHKDHLRFSAFLAIPTAISDSFLVNEYQSHFP